MALTIGERVLERARRRKLALEAENPQLHLEPSADEVQPDPITGPQTPVSTEPEGTALTYRRVEEIFAPLTLIDWTPAEPKKARVKP